MENRFRIYYSIPIIKYSYNYSDIKIKRFKILISGEKYFILKIELKFSISVKCYIYLSSAIRKVC